VASRSNTIGRLVRGKDASFSQAAQGFESHAATWLKEGELPALLAIGIPPIVFSYDADEAERDRAVLRAFGAHSTAIAPAKALHIRHA
jgi:hypothetical protein